MRTYIDNAGNYGDAEGLVIYDTTAWTSDDWDTLDWARLVERQAVAQLIDAYHEQRLNPTVLDLRDRAQVSVQSNQVNREE